MWMYVLIVLDILYLVTHYGLYVFKTIMECICSTGYLCFVPSIQKDDGIHFWIEVKLTSQLIVFSNKFIMLIITFNCIPLILWATYSTCKAVMSPPINGDNEAQ